jgi:hypothetical protein
MKVDGADMDTNATGCFDRIIPVLAEIACQTLEASGTSCKVLREVWQEQQHHVKVGQSVSDEVYPRYTATNQYGAG